MKATTLLMMSSLAAQAYASAVLSFIGCVALTALAPGKVFYPNSNVYQYENAKFWSNTQVLDPECIYRPTSAQDLSKGIKALTYTLAKFAIRGGGHMGIKGANSIDNGVLIVLSNLTSIVVSADKKSVSLGPGHTWGEVYSYLQKFNLTVGGGRLSPVGVPGLLLGGGINFYGNQYGWSADQVTKYEIVLANGNIVYANKSENTDLFWALKGGSSNFGIVTKFDMIAIPSKKVWAGIYTVGQQHLPAFLAATANYSASITDPLSHIVPAIIPQPSAGEIGYIGAVILFYDSKTVSYPPCFDAFTSIPAIANTLDFKTVIEFADETGTAVLPHINDVFVAGTVVGKNYAQLLQGIQIINNTFFDALPALYAQVPPEAVVVIQLDWQPIGKLWIDATARNGVGSNALGIDIRKGTYLAYAEVIEWRGEQYTEAVNTWIASTTKAINAATKKAGLYDPFTYMGDAATFQLEDVFPGYGDANQQKLLSTSRKYDPLRVFQNLLPGGFKLGW